MKTPFTDAAAAPAPSAAYHMRRDDKKVR